MSATYIRKLPIPMEIKKEFPLSEKMANVKAKRDAEIKDVFLGKSDKFILIVGPCSADKSESVLDYIGRLKSVAETVKDKIIIIPRVYTNKPRTTGDGYKGMLHNPVPDKKPDMLEGLLSIRKLHMDVLKNFDLTSADEMLYPENYRYLSDILGYVAVGARSVENQQHRLASSGISVPVGMKNPTSGDTNVLLNSVLAATHSHRFIYRGWEVETSGNDTAHGILRGYLDTSGKYVQNYSYDNLVKINEKFALKELKSPSIIVDTNHANSGKDPFKQPEIALDVIKSRNKNSDIKKLVKGLMIESYIEDGCQDISGTVYGQSITDACLGFEKTKELILNVAEAL